MESSEAPKQVKYLIKHVDYHAEEGSSSRKEFLVFVRFMDMEKDMIKVTTARL